MPDKIVYLIRHAAPNRELKIPYDVPPGPPLTAAGQREAREVAEFLSQRGISRVIHSPLERAMQTALALAERVGAEAVGEGGIAEQRRGEANDAVRARVVDAWERLVASDHTAQALVSHGAPLKLLIEWLTEGRETFAGRRYDYGNVTPTAGVWQVRGKPGGPWEVLFIFQPSILPEGQPAPAWAGGGQVA